MKPLQTDLSIFKELKCEKSPVGIKFCHYEPEGMEKLDKKLNLCEMPQEADKVGAPFYMAPENDSCVGAFPMGWGGGPPGFAEAGLIGEKLEIYQDGRAMDNIYSQLPRFDPGICNYIAFAPLDKLTFEPDLLFLTSTPAQAEIVLRANAYSTGELYETKTSGVLACAWLLVYPFKSGKVNFITTGIGYGMKVKEIYPPGQMLIVIPYQRLQEITQNLKEMKWVLPAFTMGRDKFMESFKQLLEELMSK